MRLRVRAIQRPWTASFPSLSVCLILNRYVPVHLHGYVDLCLCVVLGLDDAVSLYGSVNICLCLWNLSLSFLDESVSVSLYVSVSLCLCLTIIYTPICIPCFVYPLALQLLRLCASLQRVPRLSATVCCILQPRTRADDVETTSVPEARESTDGALDKTTRLEEAVLAVRRCPCPPPLAAVAAMPAAASSASSRAARFCSLASCLRRSLRKAASFFRAATCACTSSSCKRPQGKKNGIVNVHLTQRRLNDKHREREREIDTKTLANKLNK